jgi:myosin heavy subunit
MNTIGKILVILNLVFALLVGGFLVIDYATRTNWKKEYEKLQSEMVVAGTNTNVSSRTQQDLVTQKKRADADRDDALQKLADEKLVSKARLEDQQRKTAEAEGRADDARLSAEKAIAEKDRLKAENKSLGETIQERDGRITALQEKAKELRQEAVAADTKAKAAQERSESMLKQIEELQRTISLREAGVGKDNSPLRSPNSPNPPPNDIKGKIEKVDSTDRTLVTISLGSDQGLQLNHTLEVYRLSPTPLYLGMIRIVDVREHVAVGQLVRSGVAGNRSALQPGDIVASKVK